MVLYLKKEFVWITSTGSDGADTSHWVLLDALDAYGALASKNKVVLADNGAHTHNVTIKTYAGAATTSTGSYTPTGDVTLNQTTDGTGFKPALSITQPTITLTGTPVKLGTTTIPATTTQSVTTGFKAGSLPTLTIKPVTIPNVTGVGELPTLKYSTVKPIVVATDGSVPSITVSGKAASSFNAISSVGTASKTSVSGETLTITDSTAPTTAAVAFTAGSMPTFKSIDASLIGTWSAGSLPTLGDAISVGSSSGWSAGTLPSASSVTVLKQDGDKTITVATGAESVLTAVPTAKATGANATFTNGITATFGGKAATISVSGTPKLTATDATVATTSAGSHNHTVSYE